MVSRLWSCLEGLLRNDTPKLGEYEELIQYVRAVSKLQGHRCVDEVVVTVARKIDILDF